MKDNSTEQLKKKKIHPMI